ncbi:MAG: hypothetical protein HOB88_00990 [Bacteroidetes bacterium]|jgi:hypothetical protein|nr:hypothetical protein [Bacteroidota bacterium]MBT4726989.1 hypothetical protein [Bacteroidota bacterium]
MKKQILIMGMIGFLTLSFNPLMAQQRPERGPQQEQVDELTDAQITTVNKILANYDSESLTADDAKAIMKAIRDAKVPGGKGVETAINDAGFDFEEIKKLAPPPARPGGKQRK